VDLSLESCGVDASHAACGGENVAVSTFCQQLVVVLQVAVHRVSRGGLHFGTHVSGALTSNGPQDVEIWGGGPWLVQGTPLLRVSIVGVSPHISSLGILAWVLSS